MLKPSTDVPRKNDRLAERHPFKGLGEPEDIAKVAVFLASEDASWVSGVALPVDGKFMQYSRYLWDSKLTRIQVATPLSDSSYDVSSTSRPKIWINNKSLDSFMMYFFRNVYTFVARYTNFYGYIPLYRFSSSLTRA